MLQSDVEWTRHHSKPMPVSEGRRSKHSQQDIEKFGSWDVSDMGTFVPERWLVQNKEGEMVFNSFAGPSLPFGGRLSVLGVSHDARRSLTFLLRWT